MLETESRTGYETRTETICVAERFRDDFLSAGYLMNRTTLLRWLPLLLVLCLSTAAAGAPPAPFPGPIAADLKGLAQVAAQPAAAFHPKHTAEIARRVRDIEEHLAAVAMPPRDADVSEVLRTAKIVLQARQQADELLNALMDRRGQFGTLPATGASRDAIRGYLQATSRLIDLCGRLRYLLYDALGHAAFRVAGDQAARHALLDLMIQYRSDIGAVVMVVLLFDPPPELRQARPAPPEIKAKVLRLCAVSQETDLLPQLARFLREGRPDPSLAIAAAEAIRAIGLPQEPPARLPREVAPPPITPRQLADHVRGIAPETLNTDLRQRRQALLDWLAIRTTRGLDGPRLRIGTMELEPGDWLLMRNPSPYNLFTDLAPGLFTHVGMVTSVQDADGLTRMVLVDLPERGTSIPATNVELFVRRSLHYVFVRHPDSKVADQLAEAARQMIGNESMFDLNFRADRVLPLAGKPLRGQKIHTYCAGLLLLAALQTDAPREDFFPVPERVAGGNTAENLARFGLSVGEGFVSPTGAFLSPKLQLVGHRRPMYDPRREIEEAIFDYFALGLMEKQITPPADLVQQVRLRLAEMAKTNPLLRTALANAANVNSELDLVAAAKAAAVVENLDDVAFGTSRQFLEAREALLAGPLNELRRAGASADELQQVAGYRRRHADLYRALEAGQLSPRQLRQQLVADYIRRGRAEIDRRFFGQTASE